MNPDRDVHLRYTKEDLENPSKKALKEYKYLTEIDIQYCDRKLIFNEVNEIRTIKNIFLNRLYGDKVQGKYVKLMSKIDKWIGENDEIIYLENKSVTRLENHRLKIKHIERIYDLISKHLMRRLEKNKYS